MQRLEHVVQSRISNAALFLVLAFSFESKVGESGKNYFQRPEFSTLINKLNLVSTYLGKIFN